MAKAVKKPRKKATNGYKMPDPLPEGEILTDTAKHSWRLGCSIGKGGFGEIYQAQEMPKTGSEYPFVIKIEPHGNGPLFVEMHFYIKNAKQADIDNFKKKNKLKTFGMPAYIGSGSHESGGAKYRFIVMEKFGADIDKLRTPNKGSLPASTVFQLAWQITYVLEYIHEMGYVHADIKGANVLLGITPATLNQAYLVDFGLATKFSADKEFKPNPKKAHDGTIEYLSRDAHHGVPTRRGDFEILAYNIIHWLGGSLPWDSKTNDPKVVQQIKEESMNDIPEFLKTCLRKKKTDILHHLLDYVNKLKFNAKPDYKKIRQWFEQEVQKNGSSVNAPLEIHGVKKRKSVSDGDFSKTEPEVVKKAPRRKKEVQKENEEVVEEVMTDAMKEILAKKKTRLAKTKKPTRKAKETDNSPEKQLMDLKEKVVPKRKQASPKVNGISNTSDEFEGYTEEMIEIQRKLKVTIRKHVVSPKARSRRNVPVVCYSEKTPDNKK